MNASIPVYNADGSLFVWESEQHADWKVSIMETKSKRKDQPVIPHS
jgi:hypothetical protein